jgi:hypothetical protein
MTAAATRAMKTATPPNAITMPHPPLCRAGRLAGAKANGSAVAGGGKLAAVRTDNASFRLEGASAATTLPS